MVNIIIGSTQKPLASEELKRYFQRDTDLEGYLIYRIPNNRNCRRGISYRCIMDF